MSIGKAARLSGAVEDKDSESYQEGHRDGMVWASEYATADELHSLVEDFELGRSYNFDASHSLYNYMDGKQHEDATSVPHYGSPFWRGFAAGAEEVLDELSSSC